MGALLALQVYVKVRAHSVKAGAHAFKPQEHVTHVMVYTRGW